MAICWLPVPHAMSSSVRLAAGPHPAKNAMSSGSADFSRCGTEKTLLKGIADAHRLEEYGVDYAVLAGAQLRELEPHLSEAFAGAIHFRASPTSSDPGMLTKAYADLFTHRGGRFLKGDARQLELAPLGLEPGCRQGLNRGPRSGSGSRSVVRRCLSTTRLSDPFGVKRGYHMHYGVKGNATLGHSVRDADGGFALAPMRKGIRLTTGVEFANRDAPPSPVQLARDEPLARELFPMTDRLEPEPWMGHRPCLPDMVR